MMAKVKESYSEFLPRVGLLSRNTGSIVIPLTEDVNPFLIRFSHSVVILYLSVVWYHPGMTPKQRKFAENYAKDPQIIKAALEAGYSQSFANKRGKWLLEQPEVVAEIQRLRNRMNERAEKSATDVVNEYARIAFTDRVDFLKEDPHCPGEYIYKAPHELSDDQRAIVEKVNMSMNELRIVNPETKEVESVVRQEYNYVLSDKANALQQMGRHFGIFDDKLKLVQHQSNPFANASPEQLEQLKRSFVGIMSGATVDGEYAEIKNVLSHDKRRTGSGR